MFSNVHLTIIGGGIMGSAIMRCLIDKDVLVPAQMTITDVKQARLQYLNKEYGVHAISDNKIAVREANIILLAVKPQQMEQVLADIAAEIKANDLIISIAAGINLDNLKLGLKHNQIVRVMPNTPAQLGEGMSVWTATKEVSEEQKTQAGAILEALGEQVYVDDEDKIDLATAISGSGPAYFFALAENMAKIGAEMGFEPETVNKIVVQTALGAGRMLKETNLSPAELRRNVTSKGGTTQAAFKVFAQQGFREMIRKAVQAAYKRAKELSSK